MENKQRLLILIVLLSSIKFIIMPIIDYQNELVSEKNKLIKTNKKMTNMIAQGAELNAQAKQIGEALQVLESKIPLYQGEAQAKLDIQQRFEVLAQSYDINLEGFTWQSTEEHEKYSFIKQGRVQLSLSSDLINIIRAHEAITELAPFIIIDNMNTQLRWRRDNLDTTISRINLDVIFRVQSDET